MLAAEFAIPTPLFRVPLVSAGASNQLKQQQQQAAIEKRQADAGLLFKPAASTAGLQRKQSATSPRPKPAKQKGRRLDQPTTTTTTSTTTTTTSLATTSLASANKSGRQLGELVLQGLQQQQQQRVGGHQPDHQRRQAPTGVASNRFTSKPAGAHEQAGAHWALFSRPDGGLAPFELLALASNLAILGAIVLVVLLGWLKSVKGKCRART